MTTFLVSAVMAEFVQNIVGGHIANLPTVQMYQCTNLPMYQCVNVSMCKCTDMEIQIGENYYLNQKAFN